jgi:hypothetical protein
MDIDEFQQKTPPRAKRSKLLPFRSQILTLRDNGYAYGQITDWLATNGIVISPERLGRFIKDQQRLLAPERTQPLSLGSTALAAEPVSEDVKGETVYGDHDPRRISQILSSPVDLDELAKHAPKRKKP